MNQINHNPKMYGLKWYFCLKKKANGLYFYEGHNEFKDGQPFKFESNAHLSQLSRMLFLHSCLVNEFIFLRSLIQFTISMTMTKEIIWHSLRWQFGLYGTEETNATQSFLDFHQYNPASAAQSPPQSATGSVDPSLNWFKSTLMGQHSRIYFPKKKKKHSRIQGQHV